MKTYKVQLMKQLEAVDHPNRLQFSNWVDDHLAENDKFDRKIFQLFISLVMLTSKIVAHGIWKICI